MTFSRSPKVQTVPVSRQIVSFAIVALMLLQNLLIISPITVQASSPALLLVDPVPSVAINKYQNSGTTGGLNDAIELLVIQNNLDMRGMIIKDFSVSMANDGGGKYQFTNNALWSSVPAGTLIVLRNNNSAADGTVGGGDFNIDTGLQNTTYFSNLGGSFDIATTDMVMIKAVGSDYNGVTGSIHVLAGGSAGAQFTAAPTPKLRASGTSGTNQFVYANNGTQTIADFNGTDAQGGAAGLTFGQGNNTTNTAYISSLRTSTPPTNPGILKFGAASYSVAENDASVSITVTRTGSSDGSVSVSYASANGTATSGTDYTTALGTLNFGVGETSKNFSVTITDDEVFEGNETVNLTLSAPTGGATLGSPNTAVLTITDNEIAPTPTPSPTPGPVATNIIINEIDSDTPGADVAEFIELYDGGAGNTSLHGLTAALYNGSTDVTYAAFDLDGYSTNADGYFTLGNAAVSGVDLVFAGNTLQNGEDAVALYVGNATDFPNGTAVRTSNLIDAIVYDTSDPDAAGLLQLLNEEQPQVNENTGGNGATNSNQRCPNGSGGARNTVTYSQSLPTADSANVCTVVTPTPTPTPTPTGTPSSSPTPTPTPAGEVGPSVVFIGPSASNVPRDGSLTINFNEPVDVTGHWFNISCVNSGLHNDALVVPGGNRYVIILETNFLNGEQCTLTLEADLVTDSDSDDSAPNTDNLAQDYTWNFTTSSGALAPYEPDVHLTMGNPSNATTDIYQPNNYLMKKPELALSYNKDRGTANWVSWHLDNVWTDGSGRNDTFRPDPQLPDNWYHVLGTDYSGSGFDRGHMTPSADRDASVPINQATFLMTNIIPQTPDNNQGPWAAQENYLRTLLPANEVYIIAGGTGEGGTGSSGFKTTIANGKVSVPSHTWKVALVIPKGDNDISRVTASARTIAILIPNVQGIRNNNWESYLTTVDAVEALTGYDFFPNVPDAIENSIEAGINGTNPPGAENQMVTVNEDMPQPITLTAASPNNNPLTYTIVTSTTQGTLSGTAPNLTYTPASNYNGSDSFTFKASSRSGTSNVATVSITVNPVNDVPVANGGTIITDEDTASLSFTLTGSDGDNDSLTFEIVTAPVNGTYNVATGVYTPNTNANGSDSFTFVAKDGVSQSSPATISITINPVNDTPTANAQSVMTDEDTAKAVTLSGSDIDGDSLTYTVITAPAHGTFVNGVYTPAANYYGSDSFTFKANDGKADSAAATISITVIPVNDAPTANNNQGSQSVQYSDSIQIVTVTGVDVETAGSALTAAAEFSTDSGTTWIAGIPSGLAFSSGNNGTWTVSGVANVTAGSYLIRVTVTDANQSSASTNFTVNANKEITATEYTGDFDLMTAGPAINTATVRLGAKLTQQDDGSAGDITKATVRFEIIKFGDSSPTYIVPADAPIGVNASGEATTTFTLPADTYTINVKVSGNNGYWTANPISPGLLNITVPTDEQRSSGGGWVPDTTSTSGKANFAFSVTSNRNGQPRGNASFSFSAGGFNYVVKSNSWQDGYLQFSAEPGVTPTVFTRSNLRGNCTVQKIDPVTGLVVASFGSYTFEIFSRDGDLLNPSQRDSYSITVRDNSNAVFHQVGSQNSLVTLGGGNITNKAR